MKVTDTHYEIGGVLYDRVAKVLEFIPSQELEAWRLRVGEREAAKRARAAARRGTRVHKYIEAVLKGKKPPTMAEAYAGYVKAFERWVASKDTSESYWDGIKSELTVCSHVRRYAGTIDLAGVSVGLVDFKTSRTIWPSHVYQLHAYCVAYNLEYGHYDQDRWTKKLTVVRLDGETGDYEEAIFEYDPEIYRGFLAALELYRNYRKVFNTAG